MNKVFFKNEYEHTGTAILCRVWARDLKALSIERPQFAVYIQSIQGDFYYNLFTLNQADANRLPQSP